MGVVEREREAKRDEGLDWLAEGNLAHEAYAASSCCCCRPRLLLFAEEVLVTMMMTKGGA